ncbi:MAG TPA: hypothetical protein VFR87_21105 [Nocardioidaceae bacterium]|nr:hypothetical protein [Nocardioidaceae bacterium]
MTELLIGLSFAVAGAGVVIGVLAYLATFRLRVGLTVALDLLLAAGLLRLTASDAWGPTLAVGAVVLVRHVAVAGFRTARRTRPQAA